MPEIPDLENFARNLRKHFQGKKLQKVAVYESRTKSDPESQLKKALEKSTLEDIYRVGKETRFRFSNGNILRLHLMLHGDLYLYDKENEHKFTRAELLFEGGKGLAITDWQKNANIRLVTEEQPGLDALDPKMNYSYLKKKLNASSATVKNILRDQDFIRGLGNAYTDEILWVAKINPYSVAKAIPDDKIKLLAKAIKSVLKHAINYIATNHPDNITGEIRDFLNVHNSKRKESPNGAEIKKEKKGGSNTYYTDEQELYF